MSICHTCGTDPCSLETDGSVRSIAMTYDVPLSAIGTRVASPVWIEADIIDGLMFVRAVTEVETGLEVFHVLTPEAQGEIVAAVKDATS